MPKDENVTLRYDDEIADDIIRELGIEVEVGVNAIANAYKQNVPTDTGNLADSIHSGAEVTANEVRGAVWTESDGYAAPVELGSGLWGPKKDYIYPKTKKFLHWRDSKTGAKIFARRVKGHPPQPAFQPAIDETIPKIRKNFEKIVTRVGFPDPL